jgi:hypothetical protein
MASTSKALLALALGFALPSGQLAAQGGVKVAVGGFETDGSVGMPRDAYDALGRALTAILEAELRSRGQVQVVSIGAMRSPRPGRVDIVASREAAAKAGAKVVIIGTLLDQYGDIRLEARLLDPATGAPLGQLRDGANAVTREHLAEAISEMAVRLAAEPTLGGKTVASPSTQSVPVDALLEFGRGLRAEGAGDRTTAAESFRQAVRLAPDFRLAAESLRRVSG